MSAATPGLASPGITLESSFTNANGSLPVAALKAAGGGLYYGTTVYGGAAGLGAIYSFTPGSNGPSAAVPAPLPMMGAGAALSGSRRLRRRVRQAKPITPIQD